MAIVGIRGGGKPTVDQRSTVRLVREGDLIAEVAVTYVESESGWSPYLSLEDSNKLDDVRDALRARDVPRAVTLAHCVYRLAPVDS